MGHLNDENKLKDDKKNNKTEKFEKFCKCIKFITIRNKLTVSGNVVHSILNYKLKRPVSILRLHKE